MRLEALVSGLDVPLSFADTAPSFGDAPKPERPASFQSEPVAAADEIATENLAKIVAADGLDTVVASGGTHEIHDSMHAESSGATSQDSDWPLSPRIIKCLCCDKSFARQSHLNSHLRTHSGLKPFACEFCNKTFTQSGSLNRHRRTHQEIVGSPESLVPQQIDKLVHRPIKGNEVHTFARSPTDLSTAAKCLYCNNGYPEGTLKNHMRLCRSKVIRHSQVVHEQQRKYFQYQQQLIHLHHLENKLLHQQRTRRTRDSESCLLKPASSSPRTRQCITPADAMATPSVPHSPGIGVGNRAIPAITVPITCDQYLRQQQLRWHHQKEFESGLVAQILPHTPLQPHGVPIALPVMAQTVDRESLRKVRRGHRESNALYWC